MKSTLQSEQSDHFFILSCPTCVVVVVSCFRCKCFPPSKYMRRFIRHKRDLKHRQRNKRQRRFASLSSAASFTDNDFFFAKNFALQQSCYSIQGCCNHFIPAHARITRAYSHVLQDNKSSIFSVHNIAPNAGQRFAFV